MILFSGPALIRDMPISLPGLPWERGSGCWGHLAHLHIHDNCGIDDEHLPPGRGEIDFSGLRLLQGNPEIALVSEAYGFTAEAKAFLDFFKDM